MDRKFWLIGGVTAAVISGAYVYWTSGRSNKKKGQSKNFKLKVQSEGEMISDEMSFNCCKHLHCICI